MSIILKAMMTCSHVCSVVLRLYTVCGEMDNVSMLETSTEINKKVYCSKYATVASKAALQSHLNVVIYKSTATLASL